MINKDSSTGYVEDMVRSFVQLSAIEVHAKTELELAETNHRDALLMYDIEMNTPTSEKALDVQSENLDNAEDALEDAKDWVITVQELRRESQRRLLAHAKKPDMHVWCRMKHMAMAMYTAFEVWQASENQADFDHYININNAFIESTAKFLGMDIDSCAACFTDALKGM